MPKRFSIGSILGFFFALLVATGCQQGRQQITEPVKVTDGTTNERIGDQVFRFDVLGEDALADGVVTGNLLSPNSEAGRAYLIQLALGVPEGLLDLPVRNAVAARDTVEATGSLTVGIPIGLIGEQQVFGGVVTGVSDALSEKLGRLKMIDLEPLHVKSAVASAPNGDFVLAFFGCVRNCTETSKQEPILSLPIQAVDEQHGLLMVDLAAIGRELNLIDIIDPGGQYTQLDTVSAKTTTVDYSVSTLTFDIETLMKPKDPTDTTSLPLTRFTSRWYLKLTSVFNPAFVPRRATSGVGYFMTLRSADAKIHRFSQTPGPGGAAPVKYYVKNVPQEYKGAFASAFDEWNNTFKGITGASLIEYEFIDKDDPQAKLIVAGDVRYNVVEWDLDNLAPYGGLGPSISNQFTGQILSSNVLVQGPKIVEIYTEWFGVSARVNELRERGLDDEADTLEREASLALQKKLAQGTGGTFQMKLGDLTMRVPSQQESLHDPLMRRVDFEPLPAGISYEQYMKGYFHELLAHELGHNIGLRHNFRGNLGAAEGEPALGKVSVSIMEYMGRPFRYLNTISAYDVMAIKYAYQGTAPTDLGMFCTDEDVAEFSKPFNSPECSRDDASHDPYTFFEDRLVRALDLLVAKGSSEASGWTVADMDTELTATVNGLGLYAVSAELTGATWTNFFTGGDRPDSPAGVRAYVLGSVKSRLCDASLADVVAAKATALAKLDTLSKISSLREKAAELLAPVGLTPAELSCGQVGWAFPGPEDLPARRPLCLSTGGVFLLFYVSMDHSEFLYAALAQLEKPTEAKEFMADLCSETEISEMATRMRAAFLLHKGHTYTAVTDATGLSSSTIARVSRCLKREGSLYQLLINRLEAKV